MVYSINIISSTHPCDGTLEISKDNVITFNGSGFSNKVYFGNRIEAAWYIKSEDSVNTANSRNVDYVLENYHGNGKVSLVNNSTSGSFEIHPGAYEDDVRFYSDPESGDTSEISRRSVNLDIKVGSYSLIIYDFGNSVKRKIVFTIVDSIYKVNTIGTTNPCGTLAFNSMNHLVYYGGNFVSGKKPVWVLYAGKNLTINTDPTVTDIVATGVMLVSSNETSGIIIKEGNYPNYVFDSSGNQLLDAMKNPIKQIVDRGDFNFKISTDTNYLFSILNYNRKILFKIDYEAPTTFAPTTSAPTTSAPTTFAPTTSAPITFAPTTSAPITFAPTTFAPTTFVPTTFAPTTFAPTTFAPTTFAPTTFAPTTRASTTQIPTTFIQPKTTMPWMTISAPTEKTIPPNVDNVNKLNEYISKKQAADSKISLVNGDSKKSLLEVRKDDAAKSAIENNSTLMLGTFAIATLIIGIVVVY